MKKPNKKRSRYIARLNYEHRRIVVFVNAVHGLEKFKMTSSEFIKIYGRGEPITFSGKYEID